MRRVACREAAGACQGAAVRRPGPGWPMVPLACCVQPAGRRVAGVDGCQRRTGSRGHDQRPDELAASLSGLSGLLEGANSKIVPYAI